MRVLVAYGTKHGGTGGLARAVAEGLVEAGHAVDVLPAAKVDSLEGWDAVVVGGALYAWFWHRDARRFVRRHVDELQLRPVWFFSSGPLDDSARKQELPPTGPVARLARLAGARSHKTFGGRLAPEVKSAVKVRGDFRDLEATRAWGKGVGAELASLPMRRVPLPKGMTVFHRVVLGLCAFTGATAVGGGLGLVRSPLGSPSLPPVSLLEHSPFHSFLIPGLLLLLVVVGGGNLVAALLEARRFRGSELVALGAGGALMVWIVTQWAMLRTLSWLHLVYLALGIATVGGALWLWRARHRLAELGRWAHERSQRPEPVRQQ